MGRLYRSVRERQFASGISAMNYAPRDSGVFMIRTEGDPRGPGMLRARPGNSPLRGDAPSAHEVRRATRLFEAR